MDTEKLWTKDFILVSVMNLFIALTLYLLLVTTPSYALNEFHTSTSIAGLVSGIFIIGGLFGRLGIGRIIDDVENRKVLILSALIFAITSALYLVANNLPLLILNRFLQGMAFGVATTTLGTIVANIIPLHRRGEGIGYFMMSTIIATAIGPFIGILLLEYASFEIIFIFNLILSLLFLAISFTVSEPQHILPRPEKIENKGKFKISNFLEFKAIPISLVALIMSFAYSSVLTFISIYAQEIHLVEAASMFFVVYAAVVLLSRPFSGRLLDSKGANIVMYPCLFIFAIAMLLFSQARLGITLLLAGALFGLGYGNFQSVAQAIAIKAAPLHKVGLATATFFMFYDLGFGIGPYLFGLIIPFTGYRNLYSIMVVVILAAVVLYYLVHAKKANRLILVK